MKWIGQNIQSFISRFRSDVYLEDISTSTETDMLVVDSDGKVTKRAIDAITVDVSDFMTNGTDNYVLTATGTDAMNAEANLTFDGENLTITSATSQKPVVEIKSTTNDGKGSTLQFTSDKGGAGADGDGIGAILFVSDDAAQTQTSFASIVAQVSEADDTDEAGKLTLNVAESDGTTTTLSPGLILEGEHATDGQVDVTIANGAASTTTVAGDLVVNGTRLTLDHATRNDIKFTNTGDEDHYIRKDGDFLRFRGHDDSTVLFELKNNSNGSNAASFPSGNLDIGGDITVGDDIILNSAGALIGFAGTAGGGDEGITYKDSGGTQRMALYFDGSDVVKLTNHAANGVVHIAAGSSTAGPGGEALVAIFSDTELQFGGSYKIGMGNSAPGSTFEISQVSAQPSLELSAWAATATAAHAGVLKFQKSGTATVNTFTAGDHTTAGEILGRIEAYGVHDGDGVSLSSYIEFANDAISDADSSPGKIVFATSDANDAGTPTPRLTIDDDGKATFTGIVEAQNIVVTDGGTITMAPLLEVLEDPGVPGQLYIGESGEGLVGKISAGG